MSLFAKPFSVGRVGRAATSALFFGLTLAAVLLFAAPLRAEDETPDAPAAVAADVDPTLSRLRRDVDDLRALVEGRLPEHLPIRRLFEIDPSDEAAAEAALAEQRRAEEEKAKAEPIITVPVEIEALTAERDELRLAFLNQPADERRKIFDAEAERLRTSLRAQVDTLAREIEALKALAGGEVPADISIKALFEVDLLDDQAVRARAAFLRERIAAARSAATARNAAEKSDETATPSPAPTPAPVSTPSPGPAPAPSLSDEVKALSEQREERLLERDELRLKILELDLEKRTELLESQSKRRLMAREQAAAEKQLADASEEARRAEEARLAALEDARMAATAAGKALADERARLEQARASLASLAAMEAERRQERLDFQERVLNLIDEFRSGVADPDLAPDAADRLYDQLVGRLSETRKRLREQLELVRTPPEVPGFSVDLDLTEDLCRERESECDALREGDRDYAALSGTLASESADARESHLDALTDDARQLNGLRLELLPRLSEAQRGAVMGLTRDGVAQAIREVDQLRLMSRSYFHRRWQRESGLQDRAMDVFAIGRLGKRVVLIVILLAAWIWLNRRAEPMLETAQARVLRSNLNRDLRLMGERWLRFARAVARDTIRLAALYALFGLLDTGDAPEMGFVRTVVLAFAWYRLCLTIPLVAIVRASAPGVRADAERVERLLRSVRMVLRYVVPIVVFLILSSRILGRGYLYGIVVRFSWIGAFPIAAILIGRWRADITDTFLKAYPDTTLAARLRATRESWTGFFPTVPAAGLLVGRFMRVSAANSLTRFRGSRQALSYLFRRRLEKHARSMNRTTASIDLLPPALVKVMDEGVADAAWRVDRFPRLESVLETAQNWRADGPGASFALVGESGVGKSTWLDELRRRLGGGDVVLADAPRDAADPAVALGFLAGALGVEGAGDGRDLGRRLAAGPSRIVLVDQAHHFMLRCVNGFAGLRVLLDAIDASRGRTLWVCAFGFYAWRHIGGVIDVGPFFDSVVELTPWNESAVESLIRLRMEKAGRRVSYEDLIVERLEGTAFENEVVRTGERYHQLLWDYADGLPRVAVHFWLRSLVRTDGDGLKVRLFEDPSAGDLEDLSEPSRFLLAALVTHDGLRAADAARVLNMSESACASMMAHLERLEVLEPRGGVYRLSTRWNRAVVRFLRRKHLLYA